LKGLFDNASADIVNPSPRASFRLVTTPTVRRQLAEVLPEPVAAAAYEFITGPLLEGPHRVGRQLSAPIQDRHSARRGTYRIIYRIDDHARTVPVLLVEHRRDAYRPR
jgi:mRNA-degrading endonuclease RelE of RelBE toxin-antitoxin system